MINILTDSCSDLSPELLEQYKIHVIRLSVFLDNRSFHDGLDIQLETLYELVTKTGQLPKTSAPSIAEFTEFYSQIPGDLFYTGISSQLSATFQNAVVSSQMLEDRKITIVDSLNLSTGIGLLVLKAAELKDLGYSLQKIKEEIETSVPKVCTSFVIDTLEYIYKGGRCSAMESIVGSLLKIRPVIEVKADGTLGIREKTRGTRKKALGTMLDGFQANLGQIDLHRVFVTHSGCDEDAVYLVEELKKIAPIEHLHITRAGATIASHCGPNTIGILYLRK
jgi:DegV family protein with EDD domain